MLQSMSLFEAGATVAPIPSTPARRFFYRCCDCLSVAATESKLPEQRNLLKGLDNMPVLEHEVIETETFECRQDRLEVAIVFLLLLGLVLGSVAFGMGYSAGRADRAAQMEFCK